MFNLGPLVARTNNDLDRGLVAAWAARGGRLRMATVGLRSGLLRYTTETGSLVERDGTPVLENEATTPGCEEPAALVADLTAQVTEIRDEIGRGERTPSLPPPPLAEVEGKLATAIGNLATCLAGTTPVRLPVSVELVQGMLASATMPSFFPAVQLAGDEYVDGGVRMVVPVEMALQLTGPNDDVIVIAASKAAPDRMGGPPMDMKAAALRSLMDLAINEIALRDTDPPTGFGNRKVIVVQPRVDIHTTVSLYPAFIRQRMAYGFMCAADTLTPPARREEAEAAADRIAVLRYGVARLERWIAGATVPPAMVAMGRPDVSRRTEYANTLAAMKSEIRTLVELRTSLGAGMPTGVGDWDDPAMWWSQPEAQPGIPAVTGRDEASFVSQSVPPSLLSGSTAQVSITMTNTGGTVWTAAEGYGLSSVGSSWGQGRIPVPRDVRTQETVSFSFPITAPGTLGATAFAWRMVNGAGLLFGDPSEPISITVTAPGEPAACAGLRDRIAAIGLEIERIEARMVGDPQRDGPRQRAINVLTAERDTATQTATSLGCAL